MPASPWSFADAVPTRLRASSSSSEALVDENTLAGERALAHGLTLSSAFGTALAVGRGLTLASASGSRSPEDETFGAALALLPTRTLLALASDMFQAKEIRVFFMFENSPSIIRLSTEACALVRIEFRLRAHIP